MSDISVVKQPDTTWRFFGGRYVYECERGELPSFVLFCQYVGSYPDLLQRVIKKVNKMKPLTRLQKLKVTLLTLSVFVRSNLKIESMRARTFVSFIFERNNGAIKVLMMLILQEMCSLVQAKSLFRSFHLLKKIRYIENFSLN